MSLINDALKRATNKAQEAIPADSQSAAPMQPVVQPRPVGLPVYFMPVLLFIISGACFFLVKGWGAKRDAGLYPQPVAIQARELQPLQTAQTIAEEKEYPIPANRSFSLETESSTPVAQQASTTESVLHVETPEAQISLKLQGIFYTTSNPSAVINSKTVYVGDTVANAKVKAIGRQSVTLLHGSETKVLTLQ